MSSVGGAKGVVDVDIGEVGELTSKRWVVFLLFWVESDVFEEDDLTGF